MRPIRIERSSDIAAPVSALWDFHMKPEALEILSPWWTGLKIVDPGEGVADGSVVRATVGPWPVRMEWEALHANVEIDHCFTDVALKSPFRHWVHHHVMEAITDDLSRLRDVVWVLPPAWLPTVAARPLLKLAFGALFKWRHRRTRQALAQIATTETSSTGRRPALVS